MPGFYVYLIASLPMLHFGVKPAISLEKFMQACRELLSEEDNKILAACAQQNTYENKINQATLNKWRVFDTILRNELVKIRAGYKKIDPAKYLRQDGITESYIFHLSLSAHRNPSILEGEKMLDEGRWHLLDDLAQGHYFDLDFLLVYCLKLLILEKWEKINDSDKKKSLEEALRS